MHFVLSPAPNLALATWLTSPSRTPNEAERRLCCYTQTNAPGLRGVGGRGDMWQDWSCKMSLSSVDSVAPAKPLSHKCTRGGRGICLPVISLSPVAMAPPRAQTRAARQGGAPHRTGHLCCPSARAWGAGAGVGDTGVGAGLNPFAVTFGSIRMSVPPPTGALPPRAQRKLGSEDVSPFPRLLNTFSCALQRRHRSRRVRPVAERFVINSLRRQCH